MRTISVEEITKNIKEMCIEANHFLSDDMDKALKNATETEKSPLGKQILNQLQENLKINVCLFDNMGWGCIENLQNAQGTDTFGTVFRARNPKTGMLDGDEIDVDFAKIAEGYGAKSYTIRTSDELGVAEVSKSETVAAAYADMQKHIKETFDY